MNVVCVVTILENHVQLYLSGLVSVTFAVRVTFPFVHTHASGLCVIVHVGLVLSTTTSDVHDSILFGFHAVSVNDHVNTSILNAQSPVKFLSVNMYIYVGPS